MRIIIYHQACPALAEETKWHYACSSSHRLQELLNDHPAEDITGYIAKDADQNPDFTDIIKTIYEHKKDLYFRNLVAASNPIEFRKQMKDELGLYFTI